MHAEYVHLLFLWEKYVAAAAFSPSLSVWNLDGGGLPLFKALLKIYFLTLLSFDGIRFRKKTRSKTKLKNTYKGNLTTNCALIIAHHSILKLLKTVKTLK